MIKRTCNRCRAQSGNNCSLGYGRRYHSLGTFIPTEYVPAEECPKPLTNDILIDLPKKWEVDALDQGDLNDQ